MTKLLPYPYGIRNAQSQDSETIVQFWQNIDKAGEPRPFGGDSSDKTQHATQIVEQAFLSKQATLLVCTCKNSIVATIAGHIFDKPAVKLTPVGVIYSLWVEPHHRRQGIGQALLSTLEATLETQGAKAIQVGWDYPNTHAASWWQKRGYTPYEVIASKLL